MEITGFLNYLPLVSMILVIFCFNAGKNLVLFIIFFWYLAIVINIFPRPYTSMKPDNCDIRARHLDYTNLPTYNYIIFISHNKYIVLFFKYVG